MISVEQIEKTQYYSFRAFHCFILGSFYFHHFHRLNDYVTIAVFIKYDQFVLNEINDAATYNITLHNTNAVSLKCN